MQQSYMGNNFNKKGALHCIPKYAVESPWGKISNHYLTAKAV